MKHWQENLLAVLFGFLIFGCIVLRQTAMVEAPTLPTPTYVHDPLMPTTPMPNCPDGWTEITTHNPMGGNYEINGFYFQLDAGESMCLPPDSPLIIH